MAFCRALSLGSLLSFGCALLSMNCVEGKPSGFRLKGGEALPPVQNSNGEWVIQSGEKAFIDWENFSIDLNEVIRFQQANEKSGVLNRVVGTESSQLLGQLLSNGAVYLVNPNGILIGSEAYIETAGFIASTLDWAGEDLEEKHFVGESDGKIINRGKINCSAGEIFLIGRTVENSGDLISGGRQGLISGCDVWIQSEGAPTVKIQIEEFDPKILEENPFALAIRQSGTMRGKEVYIDSHGLTEVSGKIEADRVRVLGEAVHLVESAEIDAQGGEVLVGGDYQGKNSAVHNAKVVWVDKDTLVKSDGKGCGNGGRIIFWADEAMIHYGQVSAQGGEKGGDGGFVEISGKMLNFGGGAKLGAPYGKTGDLLLDPTDITISSAADSGGSFSGCLSGTNTFTASGASNTINTTTLAGLLDAPCNVTISTTSGGAGAAGGSITVSSALTWTAASTLTLTADSFISITAVITNSSSSTFTAMNFTGNGTAAGSYDGIGITGSGRLVSTNGHIVLSGKGVSTSALQSCVNVGGAGIAVSGSGNITFQNCTGGGSGTANLFGVLISASVTSASGTIAFSNITAGGGSGASYGISVGSTLNAPIITASGIQGNASGTSGNHGILISSAVGSSSTTTINLSATGGGTTDTNYGISMNTGSITIGDGGTLTLTGTGGSASGGTGSLNRGIYLQAGTLTIGNTTGATAILSGTGGYGTGGSNYGVEKGGTTITFNGASTLRFSNCTGGATNGVNSSSNYGVVFSGAVTSTIAGSKIQFENITGGGGGTGASNYGMFISNVAVSAPEISMGPGDVTHIKGSNGISSGSANAGIVLGSGPGSSLGSNTVTTIISLIGVGGGSGGAQGNYGIWFSTGSINIADGGTLTLTGTGGGAPGGFINYGIYLQGGTLTIGNTTGATAILSGTGGDGNSGSNFGIQKTATTIALNGTSTLRFSNCLGGGRNGTNSSSNYGVSIAGATTITTPGAKIQFENITGGGVGTGTNNYGLYINNVAFSAPEISMGPGDTTHIMGGNLTGTGGTNYGIGVSGVSAVLGSNTLTTILSLNGVGGGIGATTANHGINLLSGTINIADTGTLTLTGTGGGGSGGGGNNNLGIVLSGTLNIGTIGNLVGATAILSGTGGNGSGGSNYGVFQSAATIAFNGPSTLRFSNCIGGGRDGGNSGSNAGVRIQAATTTTSSGSKIQFENITGGGSGTGASNFGLFINGVAVSAPEISMGPSDTTHIVGGNSSGASNYGLYVTGASGALGSTTTTTLLSLIALGGGTGSNEQGIRIDTSGKIQSANTLTLEGTASITGASANYGIYITGTNSLVTSVNGNISLTGIGYGFVGIILEAASGPSVSTTTAGTISLTSNIVSFSSTNSPVISSIGNVSINGPARLNASTTITSSGGISFSSTIDGASAGAQALVLNPGTSTITLSGAVGGTTRLGAVTINSSTTLLTVASNITANSLTVSGTVPTVLSGTSTINTSANNGAISFGGTIDGTVAGSQALTLTAGTGAITLSGVLGGSTRLGAVNITSGSALALGNNITANSLTVGSVPTTLSAATTTIDTSGNNGNISFGSTINGTVAGSQALTLTAGTGTVTFSGALGGTTTLGAVTISSASTSANAVNIGGNITATGFTITTASPVTLTGASTINTSSGPGALSFGSTIDGAFALTLTPGSSSVTFLGNIGVTSRLGALTISSGASGLSVGTGVTSILANSFTVGGTVPTTLNNTGLLTIDTTSLAGGSISFGGTVIGASAGAQVLTLAANSTGTVTFSQDVGATRLGNLNISSGNFSVGASATAIQANSFSTGSSVATTLNNTGTLTINTSATNGNISFGSTINGATAGAQALTLNAGTGSITLSGVIGATTRLGAILIATGATLLTIDNNIFANSFMVSGTVPTTLSGTSTIDTTANNGAISFGGTINATSAGAQALTLTAGTGAITLSGVLGGTTRLGAVTISSGLSLALTNNASANSFTVASVPTTLSAATTTINTSVNNGAISFGSTIDATVAGSQALTLNAGTGSITLSGALGGTTRLGAVTVSTGATLLTIGSNITANSLTVNGTVPTTLSGTSTINTSANNGSVSFGGTINAASAGSQALTFNTGTGSITFTGALGGVTRLGAVSVTAGATLLTIGSNIAANSLTVSGTVPITLAGSSTMDTSANNGNIALGGTINATVAGSQALTLAAGTGTITLSGVLGGTTRLGAVSVSSGSSLALTNNVTSNSFAVASVSTTLSAATTTINTSANNGGISFGSTINGTVAGSQALTLNAGTGAITLSGAIGGTTRLGAVTISTGSTLLTIGSNITANSFTVSGTVPTTLAGTSTIDTSGNNGIISFGGTIDGTQALTLTAGTGTITLSGVLGGTTPLGAVSISSGLSLALTNDVTANSFTVGSVPTTLSASTTTINTSGNNGAISFGNIINGTVAGSQALTLTAGAGTITLSGVLGGTTRLGAVNVSSGGALALTNNVTANSFTVASVPTTLSAGTTTINTSANNGNISFGSTINGTLAGLQAFTLNAGTGSITFSGSLGGTTRLGAVSIATGATLLTIGSNITSNSFTVSGTVPTTLSGASTIDTSANNGNIAFGGTIDGTQALTLAAGTGTITLSGILGGTTRLGAVSVSTGSSLALTNNVAANSFTVASVPTTLSAATTTIDTSANNGTISFGSTVNGTIANSQALTLDAGTGTVVFSGALGSTIPLGAVTIASASTSADAVEIGSDITATGFTITTASPVRLTGASTIDTSGGPGAISFGSTIDGNFDLTLTPGSSSVTLLGNLGAATRLGALAISSGASSLSIGTNVTSIRADSMTVAGTVPTTLNNTSLLTIDTTGISGGSISFGGPVTGASAGLQPLTLTADSAGTVTFSQDVGAIRLGALTIASGGFSVGASVTSIEANSFTTAGSVATTLNNTGALTIDTSGNNGNITFNGSIDGATAATQNLALNAGTGNITLANSLGANTSLGDVVFTNATNVNASAITANSLTQSAGSGTTTFNGALTMISDVSLTGTAFTLNAPIPAANNVTINNAGLLTITNSGFMNLNGYFNQTGIGVVQTAGEMFTNGGNISFTRAVTLTGSVTLSTGGSAGDITFGNKVDGGYDFTLTGDQIVFSNSVGNITPLRSIRATANTSTTVTGEHTVSTGPMSYIGDVILAGNMQFFNAGTQATTFANAITGNYNLILLASNAQLTVGGDVTLSGSSSSVGGNLTATSTNLTFNGQILSKGGNASPGTGSAGGTVTLTATAGSISVHNIDVSGGSGTVAGGNGGNIDLRPASNYSGDLPVGIIVINNDLSGNGNLVATAGSGGGTGGMITLSANRFAPATVATITSSSAGNDITIVAKDFVMGTYEAMTALGNIGLTCTNMTLGDLVALNDLVIFGVNINLLTHGDITILNKYGVPYTSPSLHFLGGTGYTQSGTLHPSGPLNAQNLGLAPSVFEPLLILGDPVILNYDTSPQPIPPAPFVASESSKQFAIYELGIATAQLSDQLKKRELKLLKPFSLKLSRP